MKKNTVLSFKFITTQNNSKVLSLSGAPLSILCSENHNSVFPQIPGSYMDSSLCGTLPAVLEFLLPNVLVNVFMVESTECNNSWWDIFILLFHIGDPKLNFMFSNEFEVFFFF